jgi:hypothetical protein
MQPPTQSPTQAPTQQLPHQNAPQKPLTLSAGAPSFALTSHDDPVEFQLKELRLRQNEHQQRRKSSKQLPPHIEASDVERAVGASAASAPAKATGRLNAAQHSKPSTGAAAAAAALITEGGQLAGAFNAVVPAKKSRGAKLSVHAENSTALRADAPAGTAPASSVIANTSATAARPTPAHHKIAAAAPAAVWAVGSHCKAKYSGDGKFYAAEVLEVNGDNITVSFTEYENEFQICTVHDIRAVGRRGGAAQVAASPEVPALMFTAKNRSERHAQPKQRAAVQALQTSTPAPAPPSSVQLQPPQINAGHIEHSKREPLSTGASMSTLQRSTSKNTKKQMPDHAQEWEQSTAATPHQPRTDSHSAGSDLFSVGLVTPLVQLGPPAKTATSQPAPRTKPLSAFDLAKMRADARAEEQLQQVRAAPPRGCALASVRPSCSFVSRNC